MKVEIAPIALSVAVAVAAGLTGCFAVMRRMTLAADAISHVALPGIAIAIALGIHPFFGAVTMLLVGALLIWTVERRAHVATETVIGVVFSAALAVGTMLAKGEELIEALLGGPTSLSTLELIVGLATAGAVIGSILWQRHRLIVALVSPEVARAAGINASRLDLLFLGTFSLTVALGLRYLGVLLMGSLIIIPAATAKRLSRNLNGMLVSGVTVAVLATVAGTLAAVLFHKQETGPVIVCAAAACFFLTLLLPRRI